MAENIVVKPDPTFPIANVEVAVLTALIPVQRQKMPNNSFIINAVENKPATNDRHDDHEGNQTAT